MNYESALRINKWKGEGVLSSGPFVPAQTPRLHYSACNGLTSHLMMMFADSDPLSTSYCCVLFSFQGVVGNYSVLLTLVDLWLEEVQKCSYILEVDTNMF